MPSFANPFGPELFAFFEELAANNRREWFQANKSRYEEHVKDPALTFISDFGPHLKKISPCFEAIPKAVGGSLFRIYRDTRFSNDKTPYKTHAGIHFRHRDGKDVHAPVFYLHLQPGECFAGAGVYHPDGAALGKIRQAIAERPERWQKARNDPGFREVFEIGGDSLKTAPRGYDRDHPLIDDLKRKDFIGLRPFTEDEILAADFPDRFEATCRAALPFQRFLCDALEVEI